MNENIVKRNELLAQKESKSPDTICCQCLITR